MFPSTEKLNLPVAFVCQQRMEKPFGVRHHLQIQPCTFQSHCLSQLQQLSCRSCLVLQGTETVESHTTIDLQ
jgi:hypothetical protein